MELGMNLDPGAASFHTRRVSLAPITLEFLSQRRFLDRRLAPSRASSQEFHRVRSVSMWQFVSASTFPGMPRSSAEGVACYEPHRSVGTKLERRDEGGRQ